ncbi:hypothetical protein Val02_64680 [Virgisporangium aliadipatigenens]|uniref:HdeD family acid-resistance protein n=1 Tax=Virgisporangium aliadipatigenens TaxID=741659 RepID=A0A8J3YSB7_9ACTN|nr:HdeD family acid-resistance protein [Virgisporangium aliadipatigenens]GIJ49582.1 hypothetical protein Val02_64680 [Virgisporangium aliadipatigenens]
MSETLTRYWWAVVLRGVAAVLFGASALIWPDVTVFVLVVLFGAYAFVDGVLALVAAATGEDRGRRGWLILAGVAGVLAGIVTFVWPGVTTLALLYLIAGWALVTGVLEIMAAIRLRREIQGEWLYVLSGASSVLFGILLALWPATGALALVMLIGGFAIVFGVLLVAFGLRLRRLRQERPHTGLGRAATA